MKKLLIAVALSLACSGMQAASPFITKSGTNSTPGATNYVIFPSWAGYQLIVQSVQYRTQTNTSTLGFQSGAGAWTQLATNLSTTITNQVNTTNGLTAGSWLVLEHAGTPYLAALASVSQSTNSGAGTNIVLASGGWGVAPSIGDSIYQLGPAVTIPVGTGTNAVNGNCIFAGDPGRPVVVWLGPAGNTNYAAAVGEYR